MGTTAATGRPPTVPRLTIRHELGSGKQRPPAEGAAGANGQATTAWGMGLIWPATAELTVVDLGGYRV
jgi:hypothetical protein